MLSVLVADGRGIAIKKHSISQLDLIPAYLIWMGVKIDDLVCKLPWIFRPVGDESDLHAVILVPGDFRWDCP